MANKRITEVDSIDSLNSNDSLFVNHNNTIKQVSKSNVVFDVANGGTGATNAADARANLGVAAANHEHSISELVDGTLSVTYGGTGKNKHTNNAVLTGNGNGAVNNVATASGALYATASNGAPKFGTLQIAQGGTGSSNGATGLKNLFAAGATVLSSNQYGAELPAAGTKGRIFFKKIATT
jgi:hypothetical protein